MTNKVFHCIPVFFGVIVTLVFQLVVDAADAVWLIWWITRSPDDDVEPLKTLASCSIALTIWEFYAAFIASVGLYGAFRRKRFMKNFWKPEAFVWLCHIGIGIWYLITYYQIYRDERTQHCINERAEDGDIVGAGLCWHLLSFSGAPLPYVWVTFVVQTVVQTLVLQFLWHWRRVLNNYNVAEQEEVSEGGHYYGGAAIRPVVLQLGHHLRPSGSSETTLLPTMSSAVSRMKPIP